MSVVNRYEKMLTTAYHQGNVNKNLTPVRTTIIKKNIKKMTSVDEDMEKKDPGNVGRNVNWLSHCGKNSMEFPKKLKYNSYDPAISWVFI